MHRASFEPPAFRIIAKEPEARCTGSGERGQKKGGRKNSNHGAPSTDEHHGELETVQRHEPGARVPPASPKRRRRKGEPAVQLSGVVRPCHAVDDAALIDDIGGARRVVAELAAQLLHVRTGSRC